MMIYKKGKREKETWSDPIFLILNKTTNFGEGVQD